MYLVVSLYDSIYVYTVTYKNFRHHRMFCWIALVWILKQWFLTLTEHQSHLDTWVSLSRDSVSVYLSGGPGILCFIISPGNSNVQPKLRIIDLEEIMDWNWDLLKGREPDVLIHRNHGAFKIKNHKISLIKTFISYLSGVSMIIFRFLRLQVLN